MKKARTVMGKRSTIVRKLEQLARRRFSHFPGVVGVGIGVKYHERAGRFAVCAHDNCPLHYTHLSIVIYVKRKYAPRTYKLPERITLTVSGKNRQTRKTFPVDVVQCGLKPLARPRIRRRTGHSSAQYQSGTWPYPNSGQCAPGSRVYFEWDSSESNARWSIGTIGCIATPPVGAPDRSPVFLTAAHTLMDPYNAGARIPPLDYPVRVGFQGVITSCTLGPVGMRMQPEHIDGPYGLIDAIAAPVCQNIQTLTWPQQTVVADAADLGTMQGMDAFLRVERTSGTTWLTGKIEAVNAAGESRLLGPKLFLPQTISFRFSGDETSEKGDSGAPLVLVKGDQQFLLGFHLRETERSDRSPDSHTLSICISADATLRHLGLTLAQPAASPRPE